MPKQGNDMVAQAVYLAQLSAAKNNCKCDCCRLLRKATEQMTAAMLADNSGGSAGMNGMAGGVAELMGANAGNQED